jgi:hypothetical protein
VTKIKKDLDIDFIGGGRTLTKEDEIAISKFIAESKERNKKKSARKKATSKPKKTTV